MADALLANPSALVLGPACPTPSPRLAAAARRMTARLAALAASLGGAAAELADGLRALAGEATLTGAIDGSCLDRPTTVDPIDRLISAAGLLPVEVDLVVLAGLTDEHEAVAAALRRLAPTARPYATAGLAAQLAEAGLLPGLGDDPATARLALRAVITDGAATAASWIEAAGDGAFWDRDLRLAPGLWPALHGTPRLPGDAQPLAIAPVDPAGIGWRFDHTERRIAEAVARRDDVTIVIRAPRPLVAAGRAVSIVAAAGARAAPADVHDRATRDVATAVAATAVASGAVPVLHTTSTTVPDLTGVPGPVVVATPDNSTTPLTTRPVIAMTVTPLDRHARRRLFAATAGHHAACPPGFDIVDASIAAREPQAASSATGDVCAGAVLVHPTAQWRDLVVPDDALVKLQEAADRAANEATVLGEWRFLAGRPGASGLRLLFCGPPGTGKTLAAEALANALERDLLIVDLSRLVSKWIGETEKNLAAAFDVAERGDCVLFFDEADALFGRRTEVGDARDRYANLETAYLLGRLERFDGVAVLATNLRQNIDPAFGRRLEFVVPFDPPGPDERLALWRRHLPPTAPLADDVDFTQLAAVYAVVGASIRNATVAAAYLAAAEGAQLGRRHLLHALRREYEKAGLAFPGVLPERNATRKEPR